METQETTITTPPIKERVPTVYVIQEISGTRYGAPKINIIGASKYGEFVFCLPVCFVTDLGSQNVDS